MSILGSVGLIEWEARSDPWEIFIRIRCLTSFFSFDVKRTKKREGEEARRKQ
jgi:hypothetical protein